MPSIRLLVLTSIILCGSAARAQEPKPAEDDVATIVRTYNVADLLRVAADYPLDSDIVPPTGFGRIDQNGGGLFVDPGAVESRKSAPKESLDPLARLIIQLVDQDSWQENGGSVGRIEPFNSLLVIRQTKDNHEKINALLNDIRSQAGPSQIVAVRATWVLLAPGDAPPPSSVVAPDWLAKQKIYCEGRTVCFSGQTVHITSGRGRTLISELTPIVGDSSVAFDPHVSLVQSGVSLQIAPQLVPGSQTAILDLRSYASEWDDTTAAPVSGVVATQPVGQAQTTSAVDRADILAQEMKTTLRAPLDKLVVVGGMTLDPAAQEQQGKQLCLIVEVNAVN